ncbi:MAG: hypothetical protein RLZZ244_2029, partial [Verrucomicrobiota bacterium]
LALERRVDLAVVALPAARVQRALYECALAGVRAAVVISSGFREQGRAGWEREQWCLSEVRRAGMRLLGPNCLGLQVPRLGLNATFARGMAMPGHIALLSQSGALCSAAVDWGWRERVGFGWVVSLGTMADIGWAELLEFAVQDTQTRAVACYMESVGDARRFLESAERVARCKPMIVLKAGGSPGAARAAVSHTGRLTGADRVYDAAFERAGVQRVECLESLLKTAELAACSCGSGRGGVAIVGNAGGAGALASGALERHGGRLAVFAPRTIRALEAGVSRGLQVANPLDLGGAARAADYADALRVLSDAEEVDAMLVILSPQTMTEVEETARAVCALRSRSGKIVLASWMGGAGVDAGRRILAAAGVVHFDFPDTAARVFAEHQRSREGGKCPGTWSWAEGLSGRGIGSAARGLEDGRGASPSGFWGREEREVLAVGDSLRRVAGYGIPVVEGREAFSEAEALRSAESVGYPVVLKVISHRVTHKRRAGGVKLGLGSSDAVREAWRSMERGFATRSGFTEEGGRGDFCGVLVQPMMRSEGPELILGGYRDAQFGPVLLFGAGGSWVAARADTALALAPLDLGQARRLIEKTGVYSELYGVDQAFPGTLPALDAMLVSLGRMMVECPRILEAEMNPVLIMSGGVVAVDARIVQSAGSARRVDPAAMGGPGAMTWARGEDAGGGRVESDGCHGAWESWR